MQPHLFTPGPVSIPYEIRQRGAEPLVSHRSGPFFSLLEEISARLKRLLGTKEPPVLFPGSGTGALEALAANLIVPGDRVISFSCGAFGDRFREIAGRRGADVIPVDIPWGRGVTPDDVKDALARCPDPAAVLLTHNETSTGAVTPLGECIAALPPDGPLVLVDAVSSLGAMPCFPEEWGIDGLASCSQKGLLTPPGIAVAALSPRGWARAGSRPCPSYYFDLSLHRRFLEKDRPQNPYTPPVTLLYSLDEALRYLEDFGFGEWFRLKARTAGTFASACEAMGLSLYVEEPAFRSPAVTAVKVPDGKGKDMKRALEALGVDAAAGQGKLTSLLRVAHYSPGGWPELSLIAGSIYGAGKMCGLDLRPDFPESAWNCWTKEGE
ncbi:MAG: alanine--glyoxylate aminotransferase family protein [Aminivibrio sp.]|jgi:aspartate aminotransferase-like enzyme|nr:alanine--glyoxylate aminotransferase family protein [Aminivibrio sp.]